LERDLIRQMFISFQSKDDNIVTGAYPPDLTRLNRKARFEIAGMTYFSDQVVNGIVDLCKVLIHTYMEKVFHMEKYFDMQKEPDFNEARIVYVIFNSPRSSRYYGLRELLTMMPEEVKDVIHDESVKYIKGHENFTERSLLFAAAMTGDVEFFKIFWERMPELRKEVQESKRDYSCIEDPDFASNVAEFMILSSANDATLEVYFEFEVAGIFSCLSKKLLDKVIRLGDCKSMAGLRHGPFCKYSSSFLVQKIVNEAEKFKRLDFVKALFSEDPNILQLRRTNNILEFKKIEKFLLEKNEKKNNRVFN